MIIKNLKKVIILIIMSICHTNLNAASWTQQTGWTLAYEHDSSGSVISGNLNDLLLAINNGADVKVAYTNSVGQKAFIKCDVILLSSDSLPVCESTKIISVKTVEYDDLSFNDTPYHLYMLLSVKGKRVISGWKVGEHTNVNNTIDYLGMKWFVSND